MPEPRTPTTYPFGAGDVPITAYRWGPEVARIPPDNRDEVDREIADWLDRVLE